MAYPDSYSQSTRDGTDSGTLKDFEGRLYMSHHCNMDCCHKGKRALMEKKNEKENRENKALSIFLPN